MGLSNYPSLLSFAVRNIHYLKKDGEEWVPGNIISDRTAPVISFSEDHHVRFGALYGYSRGPQKLPSVKPMPKFYLHQIPDSPDQPGRDMRFSVRIKYTGFSVGNNGVGSAPGIVWGPLKL